jgi:magnesium transporter
MFKTRYALPGTPPATLTSLSPDEASPTVIRWMEYDAGTFTEHSVQKVAELPMPNSGDGKVHWIEFNGLSDLEALKTLGEKYSLHPLTLEDVLHAGQRPKVEPYDDHLFIVALMIYLDADDGRMIGEQVSMILGNGFLLTIQEDPKCDVFEPIRQRIRSGKGWLRKMGPDYLTYALLDAIIDHCFPILENLGEALEDLETEMLQRPTTQCVATLHDHRRTLVQLRRAVWPERDLVNSLLHDESPFITAPTKVFLRDCYDHTMRIMDLIESYREISAGLLELYLSAVGMRTNEIMRVLTVISAFVIPLTFIVGIYGMNFDNKDGQHWLNMPELHARYGYVCLWLFMLTVVVAMYVFFRRKKWL